jgi:hypothetical protein
VEGTAVADARVLAVGGVATATAVAYLAGRGRDRRRLPAELAAGPLPLRELQHGDLFTVEHWNGLVAAIRQLQRLHWPD